MPRLTLVGEQRAGEDDDVRLAEALLRGDPGSAFAAWTRFRPTVDRTLRRLMGPDRDLADLGQEVFLRFFRKIGNLRDPAAMRAFLTGICLRVVRRELRRRWLRRFLQLSPGGDPPELETVPDIESREVLRRYYALLERLGGEGRSLYVARQIEGLPMADVAAHHGLSLSTAQRRLKRITGRVAAMVDADPVLSDFLAGATPKEPQ